MSDMMNTTSTASAEIQHTSRAHARLNASSSHRWMMCPPSVKLSEQFEDKPSTYAEEGTYLHELCELKLRRYLGDMTAEAVEAQYAEHRDGEFYSDEAETVTDEYVAFCIETIEAVRSSCPDPLIMVEYRLDYSEYVPEGFGTGDLVIVADGRQPGYSDGMTLPELQNLMVQYGAQTALNLDGGGSTELWFSGQILNSPCGGHERRLSDIICF